MGSIHKDAGVIARDFQGTPSELGALATVRLCIFTPTTSLWMLPTHWPLLARTPAPCWRWLIPP